MEEMVDIANASRPKLLVLYHQRPGPNDAALEFIRARYDGRVVVARDLDVFK
jgi:ribonuclease BN (tRNA processing enzyme)